MKTSEIKSMAHAYLAVLEAAKSPFAKKDDEDKKAPVTDKEDDGEGMDPVDKKALKKDFKDREDKDIDNDGDTDSSDEFLHKKRKAISKSVEKETEVDEALKVDTKIRMAADKMKRKMEKEGKSSADIAKAIEINFPSLSEEAELDEAAPKIKPDFLKTQRAKDNAHDNAMGRTNTGRKKPVKTMTSTQRSMASMRKEEAEEVDEKNLTPKQIKQALASKSAQAKGKDKVSVKKAPWDVKEGLQKWSIYRRILEKKETANATAPEEMDDKASQGAKDFVAIHDPTRQPEDYVDINKVVAMNKADQDKNLPNKAKENK